MVTKTSGPEGDGAVPTRLEPVRIRSQGSIKCFARIGGSMLGLLVLSAAAAAAVPPAPKAEVVAQAKVRVLRAVTASKDGWSKTAGSNKKEILVREPSGQLVLVRVVDYE
jgi:hypothetical protein